MPNPAPRWQKVLRDLGGNKGRTVLVVLSIAVGVFAVGAITTTQLLLSPRLAAVYAATTPASASLSVNKPFGEDLAASVRRIEGVGAAEGLRTETIRVRTGADEWRQLQITAREDFQALTLNKITSQRGAWPPPRREIVIERNAFSFLKAAIGDDVTVEVADGKQFTLRVAGTAHDIGTPPAVFTGTVYAYATVETLDWLGLTPDPADAAVTSQTSAPQAQLSKRAFTQLSFTVAENTGDVDHIREVAGRVKHRIEQNDLTVLGTEIPVPGEHPASSTLQSLLLTMGILGTLSLFLSGFLVVNTVTAILTQQITQIGVMKAIGARTGQLLGMYLVTIVAYGILAFALAAPLAAYAGYGLATYLAGLLNFDMEPISVPAQALILEALVALLVPVLAALLPVLSGTRLSVREALNAAGGTTAFGRGWFDRLIESLRGLPRPMLLSLRNTFRRKGRLALTLTTLTLGGAIFIGVLSLRASILATVDDALAYFQYDVQVRLADSYRGDHVVDEALQVPGVTSAEVWAFGSVRRLRPDGREGNSTLVIAPPADTAMIQPTLIDGRWLLPEDDDAVVLNSAVLKDEPELKVGDTVTLMVGKKETTWRVVGMVRSTLSGPIVYANYPVFSRLNGTPGRASQLQVTTEKHDAASQEAVAIALKTRLDESRLRVASTETVSAMRAGIDKQIEIIILLMAAMAVLMAAVGGLGLMGTMGINVLERSREIGVMRAIGAPTFAMLQIFVVEGMLIGALSWVVGAIAAIPISKLMSDAIGPALFQSQLTYTFSLPGAALWLGMVLALAAIATLMPALRASRLTVRAVLAYE
jgi:putative ABC transport system permease protein